MSIERSDRIETRSMTTRQTDEINADERRRVANTMAQLEARERDLFEREQRLREREETLRTTPEETKLGETDTLAFLMREIVALRTENQLHLPNHQVSEALASIPRYDGKNMPLSSYIRACKRARQLIPTYPEELFTQAAIRKLQDSAYVAIERHHPRTMLELGSRLRQTLGTYYSLDFHRAELRNVLMSETEPIIDYIGRVQDLHEGLLDEERFWGGLTESKKQEIDELALKSFCSGLPLDYHPYLNDLRCRDLGDAYDKAIQLHSSIQHEWDRRGLARPRPQYKTKSYQERPMDYYYYESKRKSTPNTRPTRPPPDPGACSYCERIGHTQAQCYKKSRDQQRRSQTQVHGPYTPPPENSRQSSPSSHYSPSSSRDQRHIKKCSYCKNIGHTIEECRKKRWREAQSGNEPTSLGKGAPAETTSARPVRTIKEEKPLASTSSN